MKNRFISKQILPLLIGTLCSCFTVHATEIVPTAEAHLSAPTVSTPDWSSEFPSPSPEQTKQLERGLSLSNLPGPTQKTGLFSASAAPKTQSLPSNASTSLAFPAPPAPSNNTIFQYADFRAKAKIPAKYTSNTMESSVATSGKNVFYTGNWFAARSANGGKTFKYVSAFKDLSDLCCDQVTLYDESRDITLWYRQTISDANGSNKFRLGVSIDGGVKFCNYDISPTNVNPDWTGQWFDYPHLQKGANFLYIASNMFNANNEWTRTVVIRLPLDSLEACTALTMSYMSESDWFTVVPIQGAEHTMYFASNWAMSGTTNRIKIWRWPENDTSATTTEKAVDAWNLTTRGEAVCGSASGNWAGRTDHRMLTGARYEIRSSDPASTTYPGRKVLGWWWNVAQDNTFPQPYIEAAAFFEDTMEQVPGDQGRPLIWSNDTCLLYPSVSANKRGDLGMVLNISTGINKVPTLAYAIADNYTTPPPGWIYTWFRDSGAKPLDNKWGDYNTSRPFYPSQDVWVGAGHYIPKTTDCMTCSNPIYFVFGRERDRFSWTRWSTK